MRYLILLANFSATALLNYQYIPIVYQKATPMRKVLIKSNVKASSQNPYRKFDHYFHSDDDFREDSGWAQNPASFGHFKMESASQKAAKTSGKQSTTS